MANRMSGSLPAPASIAVPSPRLDHPARSPSGAASIAPTPSLPRASSPRSLPSSRSSKSSGEAYRRAPGQPSSVESTPASPPRSCRPSPLPSSPIRSTRRNASGATSRWRHAHTSAHSCPRTPARHPRHSRAQAPRDPCLPRVRRRAAAKPTGERLGSQVRSSPHPHPRPGPAGLLRCRHRRCAPADGERAALSAAGGTRMSTPAHACAPALDDRPVLATAPLKAGHAREELSRVGDPSWDLGPAVFRENARRCHVTVHFDVLEHADVQAAMRAYLYARLNVDLPGYGAKLPPASIRQAFNRARRFFAFARERLGRLDLGRIDQALVDAYARHLRDDPARRPVIVGQLLQVVTDLYHLRDHLPDGGLGFEPWAGRAAARVAGYRHVRENRTPRMPEEIVTPLLAGSLRYITTFATDILAARAALERLEARRARLLAAERGLRSEENTAERQ